MLSEFKAFSSKSLMTRFNTIGDREDRSSKNLLIDFIVELKIN